MNEISFQNSRKGRNDHKVPENIIDVADVINNPTSRYDDFCDVVFRKVYTLGSVGKSKPK